MHFISILNPITGSTSQRGVILSDNLFCKQENSRNYTAFSCSALQFFKSKWSEQKISLVWVHFSAGIPTQKCTLHTFQLNKKGVILWHPQCFWLTHEDREQSNRIKKLLSNQLFVQFALPEHSLLCSVVMKRSSFNPASKPAFPFHPCLLDLPPSLKVKASHFYDLETFSQCKQMAAFSIQELSLWLISKSNFFLPIFHFN